MHEGAFNVETEEGPKHFEGGNSETEATEREFASSAHRCSGESSVCREEILLAISLGVAEVLDGGEEGENLLTQCTALVVGSDDEASSYSIGVLTRRQVGRREGSRGAREVANY